MSRKDYIVVMALAAGSAALVLPVLVHTNTLPFALTPLSAVSGVVALMALEAFGLFLAGLVARILPFVRKLARFVSTGIFNTALDTAILNAFAYLFAVYTGPFVVLFNLISFTVTLVISYYINRSWSFEAAVRPGTKEFSLFIVVVTSSMIINSVLLYVLTTVIGPPAGITLPLWLTVAKLCTAGISLVWNFAGLHSIVFRTPRGIHDPEKIQV
jgi:putative flippase GtrA